MTAPRALALVTLAACRAAPIPEAIRFPAATPFAPRYAAIDGSGIRYIDAGRGTPVVFIHGLGASMYAWRKNLEPVMRAGYRVIALDTRGFGYSEKPATGYRNADYARLVVALLDSLRVPDAVLVGHSMGGAIAAEVAIRSPSRVRGLVLVGAAGLGVRQPLLLRIARWPLVGPLLVPFRNRGLIERLLKSTYADPAKVTDGDVDQYYAPAAEGDYGGALVGVLREFDFDGLEGRLDGVRAPTLVLWGEQDRWVPIGVGRRFATGLTRAAFLSVARAGHAVQEEAPDEVNRLLITFLNEGLPRPPGNLADAGPPVYISSTMRLMN